MATQLSYGERFLQNIMKQCEARGIPVEESESFLAHVAAREKVRVLDMTPPQMKRAQQHLDAHFVTYLDGRKRRAGFAPEAWPEGVKHGAVLAAAKAGILISTIDGTGPDGEVTEDDVRRSVEEREKQTISSEDL